MDLFKGQNLLAFVRYFETDENCKEYLAHYKWKNGFKCLKCGHSHSQIHKDFSRTCNSCGHTESATANTLFHKVKFGVLESFYLCFEMATTTQSLSASYMESRYGVAEKTARLFMHQVREAIKSSSNHPMDKVVHVDEFVVDDRKKSKTGKSYDSKMNIFNNVVERMVKADKMVQS